MQNPLELDNITLVFEMTTPTFKDWEQVLGLPNLSRVTTIIINNCNIEDWFLNALLENLDKFPNLQNFIFTDNEFNIEYFTPLINALSKLDKLTSINLSNNELSEVSYEDMQELLQALLQCKNLVSLNLSKNHLSLKVLKMIIIDLLKTKLRFLNLNDNNFEDTKDIAFLENLENNNHLQTLGLKHTNITTILLGKLIRICQALQHLNVVSNTLKEEVGLFNKSLATLKDIRILNLSNCQIAIIYLPGIINALSALKNLASLDISYNVLSCKSVIELLTKLSKNIISLNLNSVFLKNGFVDEFISALKKFINLQKLDIGHNELLPEAINVIIAQLPYFQQLQELNMSCINLDDLTTMEILSKVLPKCTKLECLDVSCAKLKTEHIITILKALYNHSNMQTLGLTGNMNVDFSSLIEYLKNTYISKVDNSETNAYTPPSISLVLEVNKNKFALLQETLQKLLVLATAYVRQKNTRKPVLPPEVLEHAIFKEYLRF